MPIASLATGVDIYYEFSGKCRRKPTPGYGLGCSPAELKNLTFKKLIPVDTQLAQPSPILYGWCIRTTKVQLFTEIERQLLGPLRFNNAAVLLEGEAMPGIQLFVGKVTDKIAPHESEVSCFVPGYRTAKKNIGLTFAAAGLPSLNEQHEWQNEFVSLSGAGVGPQPVHRLRDVILKSTVEGLYRNRLAFRVGGITQSARMNPGKV